MEIDEEVRLDRSIAAADDESESDDVGDGDSDCSCVRREAA